MRTNLEHVEAKIEITAKKNEGEIRKKKNKFRTFLG